MDPLRRAWPLLLGCAALAGPAAPASAADVVSAVAPATVSGVPPYSVTYSFRLTTGAVSEQLVFMADGPGLAKATLSGPGTLALGQLISSTAVRRCPDKRGFSEGPPDYGAAYNLTLPPDSVATVSVATLRSVPLALDDGLGFRFSLGGDLSSLAPIAVADPQLNVPRSVPLSIKARRLRGGRIAVAGATTPLLVGQSITLRYTTRWPAHWQPLARVSVRRDGSFAYTFKPKRPGLYTVKPFYHSHNPGFVSSSAACGATVKLG